MFRTKAKTSSTSTKKTTRSGATATTNGSGNFGSMVDTTIAHLQQLGINLLAIDFDQTVLDCHTGGRWQGTVEELASRVRPEFKRLINACLDNNNNTTNNGSGQPQIKVAIVTFSGQISIIRGVLEVIVGSSEFASQIPIRGADRSWSYEGGGSKERKQPYIASVVEELEQQKQNTNGSTNKSTSTMPTIQITKATTVLIDDDIKNVQCAIRDGVRAVWFNPDKPHRLFKDLSKLV